MGEAIIGAAVQVLVEKLIVVATADIRTIFGLKNELTRLRDSFTMIQAFLHDASMRQVEEESVTVWLKKLEDVAYEADNLLDEFNYQIIRRKVEMRNRKVCCFFCFTIPLLFRLKMERQIKYVNMKLEVVNRDANTYNLHRRVADCPIFLPPVVETNSMAVDPIFLGRKDDASMIINMLVNPSDDVVSVVPIVGMGGIGKTTLARSIFNDQQIQQRFNAKAWACVSGYSGSITSIFKRILESLINNGGMLISDEAILKNLKEELNGKRYLLVLDDLWNVERKYWEDFKSSLLGINSNKGNFIIVTTRSKDVGEVVNPTYQHSLRELSSDDCWDIIKMRAFANQAEVSEHLENIGRKIASRCGGLPLAANMIAGTLQGKIIDDWIAVLQNGFSYSNEDASGVLQVLKFSFDRLPSPLLKKCFAYCAIFPEDAEIEKERLIQLWMAEGFLIENDENDMESLGSRAYDILLQNSFFQETVRDKYGNIKHSKMHDLVHNLACSISKAESFDVRNCNAKSIPGRVKYLAMRTLSDQESHKMEKENAIYLRALFLGDKINDSVFHDCKNLHTLDLQETYIEDLTPSIAKLIHLRFLDMSSTNIRAFPESICKLYNLQTLRAISCNVLRELPCQLQNLVNLRHFIIESMVSTTFQMPLKIGRLTCLRTLKFFNVGQEDGRRIEELGYLKNLKGELTIRNLEHVNDKEEAAGACLIEKPNIHKLELVWSGSRESDNLNDELVLEGLKPHSNIKSLTIMRFHGDNFPSWIMSRTVGEVIQLDKLIELKLIDCERCIEIPTLGHLPRLKFLVLSGLKNIKSIGPSFYYPRNYGMDESSKRRDKPPFPLLERFILHQMANLEEWIESSTHNAFGVLSTFPRLKVLDIHGCPNMRGAPTHEFPCLKKLKIVEAGKGGVLLDKICGNNLSSLTSLMLSCVSDLTHIPQRLLYNNQSLSALCIISCPGLVHLELQGHGVGSLESVSIYDCNKLESIRYSIHGEGSGSDGLSSLRGLMILGCPELTEVSSKMLESCTSLEYLAVSECHNLVSFPARSWRMSPCLSYLDISRCPKLRSLPKDSLNCLSGLRELCIGPFSIEVGFTSFCEIFQGIQQLHSLTTLRLYGWPQFESLPNQLQHLTTLRYLELCEFGMEALPEWFGNLSSLQQLDLKRCNRLRHLPSKEVILSLTKLTDLYITECPVLSQRCQQDQSEWHKISHLPRFRCIRN
ncbi:putative disease resistance protein RGA3 [Sesamum indicum]|uniref:Disease resistance protein RGA3 n=1 Tax=Sesamum indicum TaxID=4182 RepID=A0A6I9TVH2_SESIN|nr:putative disease resistance protein RGA3 [Sesamum indicum]